MSHSHCVFCGISSDSLTTEDLSCQGWLNKLPPDTVGNRPHAFPDYREKAKIAASRARGDNHCE